MANLAETGDEDSKENADNDVDTMFKKYSQRIEEFEANICEFPLDSNNIIKHNDYLPRNEVYKHMQQCYPLVHGSVLLLIHHFINIKKKYGTKIEKELYKTMTMTQFFDRLATKRSVAFYQPNDRYLLRNGHKHSNKWYLIGTEKESEITDLDKINNITIDKKPKLSEYLSYDELLISALCGISSPTHFINDGSRRNCGKLMDKYPMEGIYIGLVGARFEKPNVMEHLLMIITESQNITNNGFVDEIKNDDEKKQEIDLSNDDFVMKYIAENTENGKNAILKLFGLFYGELSLPIYNAINNKYNDNDKHVMNRYFKKPGYGVDTTPFLDKKIYRLRIKISLELFLFDSDNRAKQRKDLNGAYCYIVGLGTGVWSLNKQQQDTMIVEEIKNIVNNSCLDNIDVIYFAWMHQKCMYKLNGKENEYIFDGDGQQNEFYVKDKNNRKIMIYFGKNNPMEILSAPYDKCLQIGMYAWDSNAFPGNEYWFGMLSSSGDPAAASCSTISYIQNSEINKEFINGKNTMIYFIDHETGKYECCKVKDIDFNKQKQQWLKKSML